MPDIKNYTVGDMIDSLEQFPRGSRVLVKKVGNESINKIIIIVEGHEWDPGPVCQFAVPELARKAADENA